MNSTGKASLSKVPKAKLNVQSFPRPPLLEQTRRHLRITWNDKQVLSTTNSFWVLETHHPPTYYIPRSAIEPPFSLERVPNRSTYCEWKGMATYWTLRNTDTGEHTDAKVWSYQQPTADFAQIKDHLAFYSSGVPWKCFVNGELVEAQPGDFYGGWKTSDITGMMKGGPGTIGW